MRTKIIEAVASDEFFLQVKEEMLKNSIENKYEGYRVEEHDLLLYKGRLYMPSDMKLRRHVLDKLHQAPYSVHPRY